MARKCTLLMTSCISPGSGAEVVRTDPQLRLKDYATSLTAWLEQKEHPFEKIVYVDNSGYDLAPLKKISRGRVDFISTDDNFIPPGIHYGYPEVRMIDLALHESPALDDGIFVKVTGRLSFPDLPRLLSRLPADCLAAVDSRQKLRSGQRYATTQLMVFDTAWYRDFIADRVAWFQPVVGRTHAENFFYHHVAAHRGDPRVHLRFPINVEPRGVGAHWGNDYSSPRMRSKATVRAIGRRLLPQVWL